MWDDSVAPETCVDFDAPHVDTQTVLLSFLYGIGFFATVYALVSLSDPVGRNPVATRAAIISHKDLVGSLGFGTYVGEDEEEGASDHDEDEDEDEDDEH